MEQYRRVVVVCVLFLMKVHVCLSCSCIPKHEQISFCDGDFALEFTVENRSVVYFHNGRYLDEATFRSFRGLNSSIKMLGFRFQYLQHYLYKIKGLVIYQGEELLNKIEMSTLISRKSSAACGLRLKRGAKYAVIGGSVQRGLFSINSCMHVNELNGLNFFHRYLVRFNLRFFYRVGCRKKCRVSDCRPGSQHCLKSSSESVCSVSQLTWKYNDFESSCVPQKARVCSWLTADGFLPKVPEHQESY